MSYGRRSDKKTYEMPKPSGMKGKPGFKPKGKSESDIIKDLAESEAKE